MTDYTTNEPVPHLTKCCTKCGETKPATNEAFYSYNGRLKNTCKACDKARIKAWQAANPDKTHASKKKHRLATRDEKNKRAKAHRLANPEKAKAYRDANAEKIKIYKSNWYKSNIEQAKLDRKSWYRSNAEKAKSYNKKYGKAWRAANAERVNIRGQRRRARKSDLPDTLTLEQWQACFEYFEGMCAVCGRPPGLFHTLAMDHWIPLSSPDCPGTVATNIVPLCHGLGGCNNAKKDKDALTWLIEKYGEKKGKALVKKIQAYFDSLI